MAATLSFDKVNRHQAAVLMHECFLVFQAQEHLNRTANEAALFTYPVEDVIALALSRLEMEALSRALQAPSPICWTSRAIALRRERFARMPAEAVAYERGTELHEGLAQFIEGLAEERKVRSRILLLAEFRQRLYVSGEALARLLESLSPGWKSKIVNSLDELFPKDKTEECDFAPA